MFVRIIQKLTRTTLKFAPFVIALIIGFAPIGGCTTEDSVEHLEKVVEYLPDGKYTWALRDIYYSTHGIQNQSGNPIAKVKVTLLNATRAVDVVGLNPSGNVFHQRFTATGETAILSAGYYRITPSYLESGVWKSYIQSQKQPGVGPSVTFYDHDAPQITIEMVGATEH